MRLSLLCTRFLFILLSFESAFATSYEHSVFLAPSLEKHNRPDSVFYESKPIDDAEGSFCIKAPHADEGVKRYCFNAQETADLLSQSAPWRGTHELRVIASIAKSLAAHSLYTQILLHVASPYVAFLPRPAGLSLVRTLIQGFFPWAAHLSLSAFSIAYLAATGQSEHYLVRQSAFRSDKEQEEYNKAHRSYGMSFTTYPLLAIIGGLRLDPDYGIIALLANQQAASDFRRNALFSEDPATGPILLQKSNGIHHQWARTLRHVSGDDSLTLKPKTVNPKFLLSKKESLTRTIEICAFDWSNLEKSKNSYLDSCTSLTLEVDGHGVRAHYGTGENYAYSFEQIQSALDVDVDQALREQQTQAEAAKGSLPLSFLWKYPRYYLSHYTTTRVLSEAFIAAGIIGTSLKLVGIDPFRRPGITLFSALMPVVGGQLVQYMESFLRIEGMMPAPVPKKLSLLKQELVSYFIANPPENGRRYIFLSPNDSEAF